MKPFMKKLHYGGFMPARGAYMRAMYYMLLLSLSTTCLGTVTFNNATSKLFIDTTNSKLFVSNPSKVSGWGQYSVVKAFGDNSANGWIEAYTNNTIVGQTGQAGITTAADTNMVDANSNAINTISIPLRTTSNLLLYTARTYSSSILVLRSRADSTNLSIRTTSNAVNLIYQNLAVPTTDSIDGTQFMRYHTGHHVFHNNGNAWSIRGWVRFNDGFTIMPLASVIMDTLTTVSGAIDLRDTGTLILNNDLYIAHNVTLTNGGNIKGQASSTGQANTIFMGGDLTLASTTYARTLHITGDWSNSGTSGNLIIDGCGHTLNIGDRAQIFVDSNITLTLRNMTIKTGPLSLNNPAIQLASHGSKLALDNVMFDLGTDFHFITGQIFVHNEVAVTGTSAFVYQSPKPSYITSGATLSFEQATTFSVAPSTFTDCPFTVNNTYTNNAFLVLADASAALSLNGCSFQTTFTGLRLSKGMVLFDNKVAIDTTAGVDLATTGTTPVGYVGGVTTGNSPRAVSWSPDSHFLAVANYSDNNLRVYSFNGSSAPTPVGGTVATGSLPIPIVWSPDGRFFAVASYNNNTLQVYRFNGSSTATPVGGTATTGTNPYSLAWSPDGRFLVVVCYTDGTMQLYRFNGSSAPALVGTFNPGISSRFVAWSPDGRFVAVVGYANQFIKVYRFNGTSTLTLVGSLQTTHNNVSVSWSPDGRFLNVKFDGSQTGLYRFYGNTPIGIATSPLSSNAWSTSWSPDGRFFVEPSAGANIIRIFRFDQTATIAQVGSNIAAGTSPISALWSPNGNFIAVVTNTTPGTLRVFRCNYVYSGQPTQGFSNGLLFGDKLKGSAFDANVNVLAGAVVKVKGMVKDDSA